MKLLVHTCCALCLGKLLGGLEEAGLERGELTAYWNNPNIHPLIEWRRRLKAVKMLCERTGLPLEGNETYGLTAFCRAVHLHEDVPEERCARCYAMRMAAAAAWAKSGGFDAFTTTLLTSVQQRHELVKAAGEAAARAAGVAFFYHDWRGAVTDERLLRMLYRQQYCGCVFSERERYEGTRLHLWPVGGGG